MVFKRPHNITSGGVHVSIERGEPHNIKSGDVHGVIERGRPHNNDSAGSRAWRLLGCC